MIRTFDIDEINSVLKHPDIWSRISDIDLDMDSFKPPIEDSIHYLFEEGILFILEPLGDDLQVHVNVTLEHRHKADRAAREATRYGFEINDRIVARIPIEYASVYGFARKYMNDDGIVDGKHHLSLEKQQWDS